MVWVVYPAEECSGTSGVAPTCTALRNLQSRHTCTSLLDSSQPCKVKTGNVPILQTWKQARRAKPPGIYPGLPADQQPPGPNNTARLLPSPARTPPSAQMFGRQPLALRDVSRSPGPHGGRQPAGTVPCVVSAAGSERPPAAPDTGHYLTALQLTLVRSTCPMPGSVLGLAQQ